MRLAAAVRRLPGFSEAGSEGERLTTNGRGDVELFASPGSDAARPSILLA